MRGVVLVMLAACGGAPRAPATTSTAESAPPHAGKRAFKDRAPIDPIAALSPGDDAEVAWLSPGKVQLELGAAWIEGPGVAKPLQVRIIDEHGGHVRLALELPHARFSLWSERTRLYSVLQRDFRIENPRAGGVDVFVQLKRGARVQRLVHKAGRTQIRYSGALEVEGWVDDAALGDTTTERPARGRFPTGRRTLMVMPGAVLRMEPKWQGDQLAVIANGYFLDTIAELEDGWVEVGYEDGDVALHGYVSRQAPPGRVHRRRVDPEAAPVPIQPTGKVASGTCLYTRKRGEPIGYIVGDDDVELDDAGDAWWTLAIDSPWGPLLFGARGPSRTELQLCAPVGAVPPSTLVPSAPSVP